MGSEFLITFCPLRWVPQGVSGRARMVEFEWNRHFVNEQVRGPFKQFRHRHVVAVEVRDGLEGTLVTDAIDYALPGGAFGVLAGGRVHGQMENAFKFRQKRLPEILATASRQAAQRQ